VFARGWNRELYHTHLPGWGLFLLSAICYIVCALLPPGRAWALHVFAYLPLWVVAGVVAAGLCAGMLVHWLSGEQTADKGTDRRLLGAAACVASALAAGFWLLQAQTFFFGDGYQLIEYTADSNPSILKSRELLESWIHHWVYRATGGSGVADAASVYQIVSIGAGVIYLVSLAVLSKGILAATERRALFVLGMASGGWMLLFFGYVENYSLFVLFVMLYCLVGIRVLKTGAARWLVVLLQILLVGFHLLGVTLIPATVYVVFHDTFVSRRIATLSSRVRAGWVVVVAAAVIGTLLIAADRYLFFRFSLVPLFPSPYVAEGYSLFSWRHLADYANLLLVLIPGGLLLALAFAKLPLRRVLQAAEMRFLLVASASTLGAAFVFDPKLGMPRDWDLFSFAGVAPAVFLLYGIIAFGGDRRNLRRLVLFAVATGLMALTARAAWIATPDVGVQHFKDYLHLDRVKGHNSWLHLISYHNTRGDSLLADQTRAEWQAAFPEERLMKEANRLFHQAKDVGGAAALVRRVIAIDPSYPDAYGFLGFVFLEMRQFDSALAYLRIADGLRPGRANDMNNMAQAYYGLGKLDKAEEVLLRAVKYDHDGYQAAYSLAQFYRMQGRMDKYVASLEQASLPAAAPKEVLEELLAAYIRQGDMERARRIWCGSEQIRRDSVFVKRAAAAAMNLDSLLRCP